MRTLPWREGNTLHTRASIPDSTFSNSEARTRNLNIETGVIHRPCCLVGAGCALVFLPLTHVRERSADWRYFIVWHLGEGARVPCGHAASRRSTGGVFHPGTVLVGSEPGDFHPP